MLGCISTMAIFPERKYFPFILFFFKFAVRKDSAWLRAIHFVVELHLRYHSVNNIKDEHGFFLQVNLVSKLIALTAHHGYPTVF